MAAQVERLVADVDAIRSKQEEHSKLVTEVILLKAGIEDLEKKLVLYVTKEEFDPIKRLFWAGLTGVAGAIGLAIVALL